MSHDHHHDHHHDRRQLLKAGLGAVAGQVGIPFALNLANIGAAAAQNSSGSDYKALVCLFMHGGNDHGNTVVATSGDSWENYVRLRAEIAMPAPGEKDGLLSIAPANLAVFGNDGLGLALHPSLQRTRALFQAGKVAILANVGPLIEPTTIDDYQRRLTRIPQRLFSHNDQQSTWQTFSPEGSQSGWGGRMVDRFASSANSAASFFSAITPGSHAGAWLSGRQTSPYTIPSSGRIGIRQVDQNLGGIVNHGQPLRDLLMLDRSNAGYLEQTLAHLNQRTLRYQRTLQDGLVAEDHAALQPVPDYPGTPGTKNALAIQFRMIGRIIASRHNIGVRRQVFFVQLGGFDTHAHQKFTHARLLSHVDQALGYFNDQMRALGVEDQVTLFTASDFGRTMSVNGNGTDHGWGSHHFILGGAVDGGKLYGRFPVFGIEAGQDARGRLVPRYSVEQYAAGLGEWFGLSQGELMEVLPNLRNFGNDRLHFMRT